nr:MAG TPA: hypothetical protein [Bacteriophage sp.]
MSLVGKALISTCILEASLVSSSDLKLISKLSELLNHSKNSIINTFPSPFSFSNLYLLSD